MRRAEADLDPHSFLSSGQNIFSTERISLHSKKDKKLLTLRMPVRIHVNFMVHREEDKFKAGAMEVVKNSKVFICLSRL